MRVARWRRTCVRKAGETSNAMSSPAGPWNHGHVASPDGMGRLFVDPSVLSGEVEVLESIAAGFFVAPFGLSHGRSSGVEDSEIVQPRWQCESSKLIVSSQRPGL